MVFGIFAFFILWYEHGIIDECNCLWDGEVSAGTVVVVGIDVGGGVSRLRDNVSFGSEGGCNYFGFIVG